MKNLIVSAAIVAKLKDKHQVSVREVEQCFENLDGGYLEDTREAHRTDPPSVWFIAPTNKGRPLKVVFVAREGKVFLKSAFEPTPEEVRIYAKYGN